MIFWFFFQFSIFWQIFSDQELILKFRTMCVSEVKNQIKTCLRMSLSLKFTQRALGCDDSKTRTSIQTWKIPTKNFRPKMAAQELIQTLRPSLFWKQEWIKQCLRMSLSRKNCENIPTDHNQRKLQNTDQNSCDDRRQPSTRLPPGVL